MPQQTTNPATGETVAAFAQIRNAAIAEVTVASARRRRSANGCQHERVRQQRSGRSTCHRWAHRLPPTP